MIHDQVITVHISPRFFVAVLFAVVSNVSSAQQPEEVGIITSAALFVRDSLGRHPIVIDAEYYRAGPAVTSVVADQVAAQLGMGRGRVEDLVRCAPPQGRERHERCTMRGGVTIIAFGRPTIRDDAAELDLAYIFVDAQSRAVGVSLRLTLTRNDSGQWRVLDAQVTGAS